MPAVFTLRRKLLADEVRRLRDAAGLTADEVAQRIGLSKSTISRLESADSELKLPVLRSLLRLYEVDPADWPRLETMTREAAEKGWWHIVGNEIREATRTLIGLEAEAQWVNDFSCTTITGLLQSPEYARAVVRKSMPESSEQDWQDVVDVRMKRQERLGQFRLWVILAEEVLLRPIGGKDVMAAQLMHLAKKASEPTIRVQVLPLGVGAHSAQGGNFVILGFQPKFDHEAVYVEGHRWDACIEGEQVDLFKRSFQELTADALSFDDSIAKLHYRAEEYTR